MAFELIVGTTNREKFVEISAYLRLDGLKLIPLFDLPDVPKIEETGLTFLENALIKAHTVYELYKKPTFADDTGLCVDYLNGMPGIFSARFAGPDATYEQNRRKLMRLLEGVPFNRRRAYFVTQIVFIDPNGEIHKIEGRVDGFITTYERGSGLFGYDPIFLYPPMGRTFAEMPVKIKNKVSHRGKALASLKSILQKWI
jgi:XTP/dITP diphosphohydrolase